MSNSVSGEPLGSQVFIIACAAAKQAAENGAHLNMHSLKLFFSIEYLQR